MARSNREGSRPNLKEVRGKKCFSEVLPPARKSARGKVVPMHFSAGPKKFAGKSGSLRGGRSIDALRGLLFGRHFDELRWL